MSASHGYSTIGGIEYDDGGYVEKTKKGEGLTSTRLINRLWRCQSIDGHLHSLLVCLVDVRLSSFCLLLTTSTIIFYSTYSAISMAHAHVLRES